MGYRGFRHLVYHVDTFPLRTYGTVPKYPDPVPKQTVLAGAGIRRIPLSPDPALLPSPPLLGVSRVTAVQIHPTISCSVRAGSTRQTVPRNRPPRCGFTQQSKRDRSATWWPGDIHTRPSVHIQPYHHLHQLAYRMQKGYNFLFGNILRYHPWATFLKYILYPIEHLFLLWGYSNYQTCFSWIWHLGVI